MTLWVFRHPSSIFVFCVMLPLFCSLRKIKYVCMYVYDHSMCTITERSIHISGLDLSADQMPMCRFRTDLQKYSMNVINADS